MPERETPQGLEYKEALEVMDNLALVSRNVGEDVVNFKGEVFDTGIAFNHETSSIDQFAKSRCEYYLDRYLPQIDGVRRFELSPYKKIALQASENSENNNQHFYLIIDELDGTTNTKRALASTLKYRPNATVSIALSLSENLGDIQTSAVYDISHQEVFSALKIGENYLSYVGNTQIRPKEIEEIRGDSATRILVVGYSNKRRIEKAEIEQSLITDPNIRVYDGSRSSSLDVLNVIRGQYDAYVDPRALWGRESGSVLEAYDVAGVIPIALGAGLTVTDIHGESWTKNGGQDRISLIVARPAIHQKVLDLVKTGINKNI